MFEVLRAIGQEGETQPEDQPAQHRAHAERFLVPSNSVAAPGAWVGTELRRAHRQFSAVRTHVEQNAGAETEEAKRSPEGKTVDKNHKQESTAGEKASTSSHIPHHVCAQLCATYAKPLAALQATTAEASLASACSLHEEESVNTHHSNDGVALRALSNALPSAVVWGWAASLWTNTTEADCPTLRSLAAVAVTQDPSCLKADRRAISHLFAPTSLSACAGGSRTSLLEAVRWADTKAAVAASTTGTTVASLSASAASRKRPRAVEMKTSTAPPPAAVAEKAQVHQEENKLSADGSVTLPLRSTAARAQVAAASRSRSRTPPPSRSRSRSPPPPLPKAATTAATATAPLASTTAASAGKRASGEATAPTNGGPSSFSFGVRVASARAGAGGSPKPARGEGVNVEEPSSCLGALRMHSGVDTAFDLTKDARVVDVDARVASPAPPLSTPPPSATSSAAVAAAAAQALRQTTLAAFTSSAQGHTAASQQQLFPQQQPQAQQQPAFAPADLAQNQSPTSLKRSSWYSPPPPSGTSKAPPYQYDLRGNHANSNNTSNSDGRDDGPYGYRAAPTPALNNPTSPHSVSNSNSGNNNPGGFVTAGEQLVSDIKQGRTMSSAYLSKRSPALGLRRTGFQPPFRDQQNPPPQQQPSGLADGQEGLRGPPPPPSSSAGGRGNTGKPQSNARTPAGGDTHQRNNSDDEDGGSYPASLLLPDGSVPPILAPLDPKLVTQVAMEILDSGAGAKQVGWDDIAGLQHAKASVEEAIVWPLRRPDLFVGLRDPPRGLLLFGPPGTGKTMIARAIANRAGCTFLNISSSSLMSKWMGDGEKLVRCLFAVATVRQPSVIFIDEIDSLLSMRGEGEMDSVRRVKTEFLVQLDGVATDRGDRVLLIGATNRPDELDEAARRRMEKRLYIPLPDEAARRELIQRLLRSLGPSHSPAHKSSGDEDNDGTGARQADSPPGTESPPHPQSPSSSTQPAVVHTLTEADLNSLVRNTHGYSGADLKQLCREAAMGPLREMSVGQLSEVSVRDLRPIQRKDFKQALKRLKPSVGPAEVERYVEWNRLFGSFNEQESDNDDDDIDSLDENAD